MRVGIKVLRNGQPAAGVSLVPNLPLTTGFPLIPAFPRTDANGEWFGVAPLAISPAVYLMDVVVDPEGSSIRISGGFDEIENQFFVDLNRLTVERQGSETESLAKATSRSTTGSSSQVRSSTSQGTRSG